MNDLKVILLMGIPGSGKTTVSKQFKNYTLINQEVLGNRNACVNLLKRSLSQNKSAIIDRTNISRVQRKYFIDVAKDYGAKVFCIFLDEPAVECIERIKKRTQPEALKINEINAMVAKFNNKLELPDCIEGIYEIITVRNNNLDTDWDAIISPEIRV